MTKSLQVSCVQLHWAKSIERNLERTLHYIQRAAEDGSRVVLFSETNLTGYYFPEVLKQPPEAVQTALERTCHAAKAHGIWVIAGTLRKTAARYTNLPHLISPAALIVHEYANAHMAGRDAQPHC